MRMNRKMDLHNEILLEHSKRQAERIARWIGGDAVRFAELVRLFLDADPLVAQRSSWVVSLCIERHPDLALPWMADLLRQAEAQSAHPAVHRNVMRSLQYVAIPRRFRGRAVQICFAFLEDGAAPVAVKAFSMTVLAAIAETEPALKNEVRMTLEPMVPYGSAGFRARARKVLARLSRP
jgi:hypothetical protein